MSTLRDDIIKLAHDNPGEIRDALLPVLKEATGWGTELKWKPAETVVTSYMVNTDKGTVFLAWNFKAGIWELQAGKILRLPVKSIHSGEAAKREAFYALKDMGFVY